MGPSNTKSYPLHRNICGLDVMMLVMAGKKRGVVFSEEGETTLDKIDHVGKLDNYIFQGDFLSSPASSTDGDGEEAPIVGWKGELQNGDLLYVPGHLVHDFVNIEPGIAVVQWYAHFGTIRRLAAYFGEQWTDEKEELVRLYLNLLKNHQAKLVAEGSAASEFAWPRELPWVDYEGLQTSTAAEWTSASGGPL